MQKKLNRDQLYLHLGVGLIFRSNTMKELECTRAKRLHDKIIF